MKIAAISDDGVTISQHFGRAPLYVVITVEESLPLALNEAEGRVNRIIYGPVSSWRLGRSLGVDLVSTKGKACSFDCIYCHLGETIHPLAERREFVTMAQLAHELEAVRHIAIDYAPFIRSCCLQLAAC